VWLLTGGKRGKAARKKKRTARTRFLQKAQGTNGFGTDGPYDRRHRRHDKKTLKTPKEGEDSDPTHRRAHKNGEGNIKIRAQIEGKSRGAGADLRDIRRDWGINKVAGDG